MQPPDDSARLMRAFCESGDPAAFRKLVERFLPLVLGAVLRRSGGDAALAEDVAQQVFADFARRMSRLRADERIGAWLYRAAHLRAGDVLKSERRRKRREQQAAAMQEIDRLPESEGWQALSPVLDEALARLRSRDREVLVLRFLDGLNLDALARSQGISTAAAQKRVERALERLREKLRKSGLKGSVLVLSGLLASRGPSEAAPALVERVASRTLEGLAASGAGPATSWISLPIAATSLLVVFGAGSLALTEKAKIETVSAGSEKALPDAPHSLVTKISALAPRDGESLEEIIAAMGALYARPLTSLDRIRLAVLFARIPDATAAKALALMDAKWTPAMLVRGNFSREEMFFRWGPVDPEAALDWALNRLVPGSVTPLADPQKWSVDVFHILSQWTYSDWASAWEWAQAKITRDGLKSTQDASLPEQFARAFTPGLVEHLGFRPGLAAMLDLQDRTDKPDYSSAIQSIAGKLENDADFRYLMDLIAERSTSPQKRVELKASVLALHGKRDWSGGLAWVREQPSDQKRARFGWALGFPIENAPPGFNATAHADWLFALDPGMKYHSYHTQINSIMEQWMPGDPGSAAAWFRHHEVFLNDRLANGIVSRLPVFAARSDPESQAWLEETKSLMRLIAAREGNPVRSYWSESFLGAEDPETEARIEAFLEQASAPQ
jgi:RNA polymerase sigma factor (sigma-70 family)